MDETEIIIARLILEDVSDILGRRKGKGRADTPLTDEELAFSIHADSARDLLRCAQDRRIASSIDSALRSDDPYLRAMSVLEMAEADDHLAAVALHNAQPLPPLSEAQRLLDSFELPSSQSVDPNVISCLQLSFSRAMPVSDDESEVTLVGALSLDHRLPNSKPWRRPEDRLRYALLKFYINDSDSPSCIVQHHSRMFRLHRKHENFEHHQSPVRSPLLPSLPGRLGQRRDP